MVFPTTKYPMSEYLGPKVITLFSIQKNGSTPQSKLQGQRFVADAEFHGTVQQGPGRCPPNVSRGALDNGGCCPPPPQTSNVVVGVGLTIVSPLLSPLPWMLLLALQPCRRRHRSCRPCQCLFCRPPPSPTLVAATITITLFARPPPLSPFPSILPPLPLSFRRPPPSSLSPSPLPPSPLPSLSPASLVTITITHLVAVTIAITLVTVNHLPPLLPSLLPAKPSLYSSHSTLVANAIARCIPLALFITRHSYPHRHCLAAFTLFVTCSHR
jgi:hypothetical protein